MKMKMKNGVVKEVWGDIRKNSAGRALSEGTVVKVSAAQ